MLKNGIALCKLHHWAFDAGLMLPVLDNDGRYGVMFTELAASLRSGQGSSGRGACNPRGVVTGQQG